MAAMNILSSAGQAHVFAQVEKICREQSIPPESPEGQVLQDLLHNLGIINKIPDPKEYA